MRSKWKFKIKVLDCYLIGEDKKIYKKPFIGKNNRYIGWREVKKQYGNRYRLQNKWYSVEHLKRITIPDDNPTEIAVELKDNPF